LIALFNLV